MVRHECGSRFFHCDLTSLAIETDQVAIQSYSEVCFPLSLTTGLILMHHISLVHKLILNAITTGTLTFLFSAIPLVLFLVDDRANCESFWWYLKPTMTDVLLGITAVPGVTALAEGRVFALTMLYSLNSRRSIRHGETNTSDAHSMTIKTATDTTNTSRECSLVYRK
jgi:hypothetical protein